MRPLIISGFMALFAVGCAEDKPEGATDECYSHEDCLEGQVCVISHDHEGDDHDHGGECEEADADPDVTDEVTMVTTLGTVVFELYTDQAPVTVSNFLLYAEAGFYDGADSAGATLFHRVVNGFVAQGGGYTADGTLKATNPPISLESDVGLSNVRGTIAMARTNDPDSATSQFYFNLVDNASLDYQDASNPGYAVFGAVTTGLEVLDAIGSTSTDAADAPTEDIVIESLTVR